ncbi:MAG: DUF4236 domain-containing protein [Rhizomicrobium sp.]
MGFYLRKSISAGPFRFNLSSSGVGMSVGVKGFRIGSGPRGNYIHMGRGGLYYRASLGGNQPQAPRVNIAPSETFSAPMPTGYYAKQQIETGNTLDMKPSNGSDIVDQINQKLGEMRLWPIALVAGVVATVVLLGDPNTAPLATVTAVLTAIGSLILYRWDQARKTVVLMYDMDEHAEAVAKQFSEEFDKLAGASRIWNVETAQRTADLKRNAGAGNLISRNQIRLAYGAPSVVKTNVSIPAILGGQQHIYFFPDVALVMRGRSAGAISYEQLETYWNTTIFIEEDGVPSDSVVVGQTWRFVNKNGGPDRRFNNNRQIPKVQYQQLGLRGPGSFQKLLQISKVADRGSFDVALRAMSRKVEQLKKIALPPPVSAK